MAVNFTPHFLSSSSVLVTGSFAMKRHGFSLKPTTKLLVNSCQTDYFKKQRFDDSSSSSLPSYSLQSEFLPDIVELQVKDVLYEPVQKKQDAMFFSASISTHPVLTMVALLHSADNAYTISGLIRGFFSIFVDDIKKLDRKKKKLICYLFYILLHVTQLCKNIRVKDSINR